MRLCMMLFVLIGVSIVESSQPARVSYADVVSPSDCGTAVLKADRIEIGPTSKTLPDGTSVTEARVVAKGHVEITIGNSVITADEAEIFRNGPGKPSEVKLGGGVRLKSVLEVK